MKEDHTNKDCNSVGISLVAPVKNESDSIVALAAEICVAMDSQPKNWECIWIDDGSTDGTLEILRKLAEADPRHRYISFEKNAGQSAALVAGFSEAAGEIIATIDGDGQNDPADLPRLAGMVGAGVADMVNGYRAKRRDTPVRRLASLAANAFRTLMTGWTVRDAGCSSRAFRRECVATLPQFTGMHRFLPTLVAMRGFKLAEVPVNHRPRLRGLSKYTLNNRIWVGMLDCIGVLWLRKRAMRFKISERSRRRPD